MYDYLFQRNFLQYMVLNCTFILRIFHSIRTLFRPQYHYQIQAFPRVHCFCMQCSVNFMFEIFSKRECRQWFLQEMIAIAYSTIKFISTRAKTLETRLATVLKALGLVDFSTQYYYSALYTIIDCYRFFNFILLQNVRVLSS